MREIKFRAWDTTRKKMWSAEELGADQETLSVDGRGFVNVSGDDLGLSQFHKHLLPLEFTGLKDSQVIEEYYGDVVIATFDGGDEWELFVIEDGPAAVLFRNIDTDEIWYFWQMPTHYVIGNIYENPELVENIYLPVLWEVRADFRLAPLVPVW